jgi:dihydroflavonol-4-reductase
MNQVLVTGGTGFIGRRLVEQLVARGYKVKVLVRDRSRAKDLPASVELVPGDTTDDESLHAALANVAGVFHLAAIYGFGIAEETMRGVNVEGTRKVLDAAAARGTVKVVYAGSDTSLGDTAGAVCDETKVHDGRSRSPYETTKREAHELCLARMAHGAPIVNAIVSTVYGPGDTSAIGQLFEHHLAGRLRFALDKKAGYTFAHVDDVAMGLILAYERGVVGESYLICGTPATFGQLFEKLSARTGIAAPSVEIPEVALPFARPLLLGVGRLLGKSFAETRELVAMGRNVTRFFSNAKAREALGFRPRSLDEGLDDVLPWYHAREREAASRTAAKARPLLVGLALFDAVLGAAAAFVPGAYMATMHARGADVPTYFARRTGAVWLFFAAAEGMAARRPAGPALLLVGALRLMDVGADLLYLASADGLGPFGRLALVLSPIFNACAGAYLLAVGARATRAKLHSPIDALEKPKASNAAHDEASRACA